VSTSPEATEIEPELARALTDLDHPQEAMESVAVAHEPQADTLPPIEPHFEVGTAGQNAGPDADRLATTSAQSAHRHSTVREPAFASSRGTPGEDAPAGQATAPPEPVVMSSEESKPDERPRRSGWWSKRVLGRH
jgi:hypothetical protein